MTAGRSRSTSANGRPESSASRATENPVGLVILSARCVAPERDDAIRMLLRCAEKAVFGCLRRADPAQGRVACGADARMRFAEAFRAYGRALET